MTDRELKRLSRMELLEMLSEQGRENSELRQKNAASERALHNKSINLEKTGSIVEAALALNGVFEAAEGAYKQMINSAKEQSQKYCDEVTSRLRSMSSEQTGAQPSPKRASERLPVLQIYGYSMTPTLSEGDVVVSVKDSSFKAGDLVAFLYRQQNSRQAVYRLTGQPLTPCGRRKCISHAVTELETVAMSEVETMTDGDRDLTLFTCTMSGTSRFTIRCERIITD